MYTVNHATLREDNISHDTSPNSLFFCFETLGHVYCTEHYGSEKYG